MYGAFLRVYFSKKMAAGDFDEIQELVDLNCHAKINEHGGQVIIQGVMLCEPDEYIEAAQSQQQSRADGLFDYDAKLLDAQLSDARPKHVEVQP